MKITEKIGDKETKLKSSMHYLYISPDSPMMCKHCKKHLGVWRMLRRSILVKKGYEYVVKCKRCGKANVIKKGEMGKRIDQRWDLKK